MGNILKKYNLTKAKWEVVGGAITGDTLPIGAIIPFGGTEAPTGWLICDGSMLNRETYKELFAAIGTNFGTDGPGNFYIPDLRGKVAVGQDTTDSDFGMGAVGGSKYLQEHNHSIKTGFDFIANSGSKTSNYAKIEGEIGTFTTANAGTGNSGNLQPYQVTNYIIKAFQSSGVVAQVSNTKSNSTTDTYSCEYINDKVEETELFYGSVTGLNSATLNDIVENYKYVEVFGGNGGKQSSVKLYVAKGKTGQLIDIGMDGALYVKYCNFSISGKTLTINNNSEWWKPKENANGGYNAEGNYITIYRVVGYK